MHDDLKRRLRDEVGAELGIRPASDLSEVIRRGRGKRVGLRLMTTLSMVLVGTAVVAGGLWVGQTISSPSEDGRSSIQPENAERSGRPAGIFADVGGWIAFGTDGGAWPPPGCRTCYGIWAVDPTRPGDPADMIQLSSKPGTPIAWSPDGSKLLFVRDVKDSDPRGANETDLFVLNADGSETRLTQGHGFVTGGSFSPDGSKVVYAVSGDQYSISVVDAGGGTPQILRTARWVEDPCCLQGATFSPDGTQIAYFEGMWDHSNTLQVMKPDGSGSRTLIEQEFGHVYGLQWSPDGERLVFGVRRSNGISVVGVDVDGTGLKQVSPAKLSSEEMPDPHWSPDGSLISYNTADSSTGDFVALVIARWDGTQVQEFDYARSGPWNPR